MAAPAQIGALIDFTPSTAIVSADVDQNFSDIRTQFNRLVNSSGGVYIGDDADANVTLGLTINQGANDDAIIAFKSSDVAHAATGVAETDTYGFISKNVAAAGGLYIVGISEDGASQNPVQISGFGGQAPTAKSSSASALVSVYASEHDGAGTLTNVTADGNVFAVRCMRGGSTATLAIVDEDGDLWLDGGLQVGGGSVSSIVTLGITVDQGANDNAIIDLKSSDVAHGLVTGVWAETDTFYSIAKTNSTLGGAAISAYAEDDASASAVMQLTAFGGQADTTKSTAGRALVEVRTFEHDGADSLTNITADGNVFGVLAYVGGSMLARMLVDEDGDMWLNGGATLGGTDGIDFEPGSNVDTDLITVGVTGTPRLWWDESEDAFVFTKSVMVDAGSSQRFLWPDGDETTPGLAAEEDRDNGFYRIGANNVGYSAGGSQVLGISTSGLTVVGDVGFYGTAPVAQQTGVAVSAAGIHAALVNLGLITA